MNRIHQLNETIYELRLRGLSERQEIRELRKAVSDQKNALEAAQAEIAVLVEQCSELRAYQQSVNDDHRNQLGGVYDDSRTFVMGEQGPGPAVCFDARQYEALSVQRAEGKPC